MYDNRYYCNLSPNKRKYSAKEKANLRKIIFFYLAMVAIGIVCGLLIVSIFRF